MAGGTLVVVVPSADGLVVASDSRTSAFGVSCNGESKITELAKPRRTVVAITGDIAFVPPPDAGVQDACAYLQLAPRTLDIPATVQHYLERKGGDPFKLSIEDLGAECVQAVKRFKDSSPRALEPYIGRDIFSVVVASYNSHSKTSLIMNFAVGIDATTHRVEADSFTRIVISPQSRRGVWSYGETDYLNKSVFGGVGRKFLSDATKDLILGNRTVASVHLNQAVSAAANVIEAATQTTWLVPSSSGIGGSIHIVLLGRKRHPQQIPWKGTR